MGQKVRPTGFRTGIMLDWQSTWYAGKQEFAELLVEDLLRREHEDFAERDDIEVVRKDGNTQTAWRFYFVERTATLVLDNYTFSVRETSRHKFKRVAWYDRLDGRNNKLTVEEAPLPDDVKAEAMRKFVEMVEVKKAVD